MESKSIKEVPKGDLDRRLIQEPLFVTFCLKSCAPSTCCFVVPFYLQLAMSRHCIVCKQSFQRMQDCQHPPQSPPLRLYRQGLSLWGTPLQMTVAQFAASLRRTALQVVPTYLCQYDAQSVDWPVTLTCLLFCPFRAYWLDSRLLASISCFRH